MDIVYGRVAEITLAVAQKEWIETPCWAVISALATALVIVTVWGVKQARGKEKVLREWLDASREQLKLVNLVNEVNRDRR